LAQANRPAEALPPPNGNGSGGASFTRPARLPRSRRGLRGLSFLVPALALALVAGAAGVWFFWFRGPAVRGDLVFTKVEEVDLQLKVVERGALEARQNHDVKCEVKAGSRGAPKIMWVVENGTLVKKGDPLVIIDDSFLQEQSLAKKIERDKAEADKIAAEQLHPVKVIAIALAEQQLQKCSSTPSR
jgi:multidrug efflux pump subunit AcrA (membrane-fusion protein)